MRNCKHKYGTSNTPIFKNSYKEIIVSAKRKHSGEFFIFCDTIGNEKWYSEASVSICGDEIEHFMKVENKWVRIYY